MTVGRERFASRFECNSYRYYANLVDAADRYTSIVCTQDKVLMLFMQNIYEVGDRRLLDSQIPAVRNPGLPGLAGVAAETFELHRR
jgi:hypothetical protein